MNQILVTGGNGQLAQCIKDKSLTVADSTFFFVDIAELDITNPNQVNAYFKENKITHCINCAAYTAVDKAETDEVLANKVNHLGAKYLASSCADNQATMLQISTDFVFDGHQSYPYKEIDTPAPLGVYGATKLLGEQTVAAIAPKHFVLRTSWLYSEHGNNFFKTMLKLGSERESLSVVADQVGTPTYAGDLAETVLHIISKDVKAYGIYHYSNEGVASWHDFAKAIFDEAKLAVKLSPINTEFYPMPAKRPTFSVMDKGKIKAAIGLEIPYWRDSLKTCIKNVQIENKTEISA